MGIDLSANPAKTGACVIDWASGEIELLPRPTLDAAVVDAVTAADMTGIDVPLGWPDAFITAVGAHHEGSGWPPVSTAPPEDREPLRFRTTDLLSRVDGARPLSVSTDRLGVAAMRGARLQALLIQRGATVDRSGTSGCLAEVYPAAALRRWGLKGSGYKGRPNRLDCHDLVEALSARCGSLSGAVVTALAGCDDDAFDALICAIIARAVLLGCTTPPGRDDLEVARREGWIHTPTADVESIVAGT